MGHLVPLALGLGPVAGQAHGAAGAKPQAICSSATTRPTSATVSWSWPMRAMAAVRPPASASVSNPAASSPTHHPPLRPEAPKPTSSASITTMRSAGSWPSR